MRFVLSMTLVIFSGVSFANTPKSCGINAPAQQLAKLIQQDPLQQRQQLRCSSLLSQVAQQKAQEMAQQGIVNHMVGGSPNTRLRSAGFNLPSNYGVSLSNQVEAIAGGYETPTDVWQGFKHSDAHRSHLLGEHPFYREQDEIGVGYVYLWDSPHVEYWVVYVAKNADKTPSTYDSNKGVPNKSISGYLLIK